MFLVGPPSIIKRRLALSYAEMTNTPVHTATLSHDTTESDLKQRREIDNYRNACFVDQPTVRAAVEGGILLLDGIEEAERNVLPMLNNLLENREMNLEDGRFLVSPDRYEKLIETTNNREGMENIVSVSDEFRVVAIGKPCPPYQGNALDPPLRSRFQARRVGEFFLLFYYIHFFSPEKIKTFRGANWM